MAGTMPAAPGAFESSRYRIGRLLGRGGLGEVYLAHDLTLGRDVAIKFLTPGKLPDADARRALLREARAAAGLDHPYICTVYEAVETADSRAFIVMQYVEGEALSELLRHGALPVRDALMLCADIADALAAAHVRGVVHRDLKPGNIIVTPSGRPKIVDFGIAQVAQSAAYAADAATQLASSTHGPLAGTPAYVSPEQLQGRPIDGRSDLFALGLVLFECLTGRRAFQGSTAVETAGEILHVHPPAPSSLRKELGDGHDELCRRLLAKDPADRFQSAGEVIGAIRVLVPDTSRTPASELPLPVRRTPARKRRVPIWSVVAMALAVIAAGVWIRTRGSALPPVPEASDVWYRRGSEALREGAYYRARKALEQAVQIFPQHALAYARLAEVAAELDDPAAASEHLVRLSQLAVNESRLPEAEQLRLQAVRALVLRDVDRAVARYRSLVEVTRSEPRALVDLGRAQEAAGRRADARESYQRAIAGDPQYAAAHLRRGVLEGLDSHWEAGLAALAEAERLYKASSDVEGETEVLLNRGAMLDVKGDGQAARRDLERALMLATSSKSVYQRVRTQLALSSVIASEGNMAESDRIASEAVNDALANGLDTVAAGGLVDLAATSLFAGKRDRAETQVQRALELAERRGATLTAARAKIQLAEVYARGDRSSEALKLIDEVLPFVKERRYRRHELTALSVAARAHERTGNLAEARRIASEVLAMADSIGDETQAAIAASSLASVTTTLGGLPEALRLRERADAIHRRQGDRAMLPYDLTNRADLLIRLGRGTEARALLSEVEAGIAAGIETYAGRRRRASFLRAFDAATELRCADALPLLDPLVADTRANDTTAVLAPAVQRFCQDRLGRHVVQVAPPLPPDADDPATRERQYWLAAAALQRGDAAAAAAEAGRGLTLLGDRANDELRWRLAAVAAVAARQQGDQAASARLSADARAASDRLRTTWRTDLDTYERRPDLAELIRKKEQR